MVTREQIRQLWDRWNAPVLALVALIAVLLTLYAGTGIGLSDNGDYYRVMTASSLTGSSSNTFYYESTYTITAEGTFWQRLMHVLFTSEGVAEYPSIQLVPVRISVALNMVMNALTGAPSDLYRIQVLGVLYSLCFFGILWLLFSSFRLPRLWADAGAKVLCLIVLCDVSYTAYFNSFYGEPVQTLSMLLMAALGLRCLRGWPERRILHLLLFFGACILYGWSKFVNLPVGALLVLAVGIPIAVLAGTRRQRITVLSAVTVSLALLIGIYCAIPTWIGDRTTFNAVFFGALKDTDPEMQKTVLEELDLPEEMLAYAGTNYYTGRAAPFRANEQQQQALDQVSQVDLLLLYLRHPGLLLEKLNVSLEHTVSVRPFYLGNTTEQVLRPELTNRCTLWSDLRHRLPSGSWGWNLLLVAGAVAVVLLTFGRRRLNQSIPLCVGVLGALLYQLVLPIVSNGEGDLMKHLFAYASAMDLLFLLVCCGLLTLFCRFRFGAVALPSLAAVLVLIAVTPVWWTSLRLALTPAETDEIGSCWTLGGLRWMVVEQDQERLTLLCLDTVASAPFCQETGDSRWTESSLRTYLNGEFLERFTQEEMALLLPRTHQVILSRLYLEEADSGDDEIYCFPVQTLADRGADRAWSKEVTDLVSLPDVTMLGDLARSGWTICGDFWLETPYYYSNGDMVRYLSSDGLILFQQSQAQHGVRPVIQIDRDAIS